MELIGVLRNLIRDWAANASGSSKKFELRSENDQLVQAIRVTVNNTASGGSAGRLEGALGSASERLYVWLQDGGNPSTRTIEGATRIYGYETNSGVCSDFSYITINGLKFQRSSGFGIYFHCYAGPAPLSGIVIENNIVSQTGTSQVDGGQYYNGMMFLQSPACVDAAPQILNNTTSYTGGHGNGINLQGANNAVISGNNVSQWNHNGIDVKYADGVTVSGNSVHDRLVSGAGLYFEQSQAAW